MSVFVETNLTILSSLQALFNTVASGIVSLVISILARFGVETFNLLPFVTQSRLQELHLLAENTAWKLQWWIPLTSMFSLQFCGQL